MQLSSLFFSALIFLYGWAGTAWHPDTQDYSSRKDANTREAEAIVWARQVLDTLTVDEKLGQLFMIPVYSNKGEDHVVKVLRLVMEEKVGGVIFMQGGPLAQTHLANLLQRNSDLPLLVSQDAEWGLAMRLDSVIRFPRNMALGAIRNDSLIYALGKKIARHCRATGVQVNFSPVADINNNAQNPVINDRSFGEDKLNVTRKSIAMMQGLQDGGVMACAKHFPGHGDTQTDSHLDLPVIPHGPERMDSLELYPFREMIQAGVQSVMVAHLFLPAYEKQPNRPSTVSKALTDSLLRKELGFKGLIFTDALNMKGISKFYANGDAEREALLAGNDILLFSESVPAAKIKIRAALDSGLISLEEIDQRVMRILTAKYELGLVPDKTTDTRSVLREVQDADSRSLKLSLYRNALTLPSDPQGLIPVPARGSQRIAYVQLGGKSQAPLPDYLNQFGRVTPVNLSLQEAESLNADKASRLLESYDLVITAIMGMERSPAKQFGIREHHKRAVQAIQKSGKKQIICLFGNPYALQFFDATQTLLVAYDEEAEAQQAVAEGIFGIQGISGMLPVTSGDFPVLTGLRTLPQSLEEALPAETGLSPDIHRKVDSVVMAAIRSGAMPGCAVLIRHKNKTVLARGYGSFRYGGKENVDPASTRYDLASVTKVAATTLSLMRLYELGLVHPDSLLEKYLPELKGMDKGKLTLRSLLLHQSGLPAFLPVQQNTLLPGKVWKPWIYASVSGPEFPLPVSRNMYQSPTWQDSVWNMILTARLSPEKKYVYSDLGLILLGKVVERITGKSLDTFAGQQFYERLGMSRTGFCPWKKAGYEAYCPPTEIDKTWRKGEVQGYVHDQTAAMLGGVSGHAGLFSTAGDLGMLMGMLCNQGVWKGDTLFRKSTVEFFTGKQPGSRRGLGWDKPAPGSENSPCSRFCSPSTFGHTGFTGTCVWADPDKQLVFIFLSNRTWPDVENRKLIQESIRTKIQDIIYNCVISG